MFANWPRANNTTTTEIRTERAIPVEFRESLNCATEASQSVTDVDKAAKRNRSESSAVSASAVAVVSPKRQYTCDGATSNTIGVTSVPVLDLTVSLQLPDHLVSNDHIPVVLASARLGDEVISFVGQG